MKRARQVDDAACRRCDDSGLLPVPSGWMICTCRAGAMVHEQRARKGRGGDY